MYAFNSPVDVLIDLKLTLKASDNQLSGWSQNQVSPCAWMYINCDGDDVVQISFPSIGFTGTLSPRIGELSYLKGLSFPGNNITGKIPEEFGNLSRLTILNLENNHLSGEIPKTLGKLTKLENLILSQNDLSGSIPDSLSNLPNLSDVSLAFNDLSGQIPDRLFKFSRYNFTGNRLNCGTNLHPCVSIVSDQKGSNHVKVEVVRGSIGVIVLLLAGVLYLKWKSRMKSRRNEVFVDVAGQNEPKIAFGQLKIFGWHELQIATDSFNERNVLGKGGFGKVYKGMLADNTKIAVKRLTNHGTPGGEAAFLHEVELISVAVHRNLLRLIGYCTTASERLLVYPFMHNLSVAYRLREFKPNEPELDWPTRKRVALGTAQGLEYLHEHCNPKIIHRDIKAANVLLDENFDPVVGDFGLAKLVDMTKTSVTTRVCGTMGHIAPEYLSTGKPSEKSDVFSYGIMLLELVTGQRAVDFSLSEGENEVLHIENEVLPTILAGTI
ncbi:LRR receptor kinase SERK2-like isoform X2 [Phoenix dactylifera]|uniref:non-specific serine/threonine protein kinase n=1 Tax=Phoenix dactylifera TaxID=42345 RepID=A0A8B9ALB7_PHODC|nr:LRR receptor kinase SERK2-like isoform X2 [Phoenix dactylifera]XP_038984823.1 LRR receptor kinase SERK2-like isoform X2 [Phoenix dactylifera]